MQENHGFYTRLRMLRNQLDTEEGQLRAAPLGPYQRRQKEKLVVKIKAELKQANEEFRAYKASKKS
jgi:hypothetical protein